MQNPIIANLDTDTLDALQSLLPTDLPRFLTVVEAAKEVDAKPTDIMKWIQTGKIQVYGSPGNPRISKSDLLTFWKREQERQQQEAEQRKRQAEQERIRKERERRQKAAEARRLRQVQRQQRRRQPQKQEPLDPYAWVDINRAARFIGVDQEIVRLCIRHNLVPAMQTASGASRVRIADFLRQDFRQRVEKVTKKTTRNTPPPGTGVNKNTKTTPKRTTARANPAFRDPDKLVVGPMLENLAQLENKPNLSDVDRRQIAMLRNAIMLRDPEALVKHRTKRTMDI